LVLRHVTAATITTTMAISTMMRRVRPMMNETPERLARIIRDEVVRQYRDDERGKCPGGAAYYEEHISPWLIALRVLEELKPHAAR
jgi:hypothetical protein